MLKELCEPYASILRKLLEIALDRFGDKLVSFVVFGSVARCEAGGDSDVDILMVFEDLPRGRFKRQEFFLELEELIEKEVEALRLQGYNIEFSPIIKTVEEAKKISPLYLDMVEDAVVLYDKNNFFTDILSKLKMKLEELGAERVKLGRKWYWRLKKSYRFGEVIEI